MTIQPGIYVIINVKGGTALDLSGGDGKSIIGFGVHRQGNQQWLVKQKDFGYTIQSVGSGKYLSVEGEPKNWTPIVANEEDTVWKIERDEEHSDVYRVFWPGSNINFDLADHGNPTPGTKVHLWEKTRGKNQTWRFDPIQQF